MSDESRKRSTDPLLEPDQDIASPLPTQSATPDPNDEIPVPIAMFPSEVDERAQVVETLRERERTADELEPEEPRASEE
jgi:hypothetical protein